MLWYSDDGEWFVSDNNDANNSDGWALRNEICSVAHCVKTGLLSPADAAEWKVWSGKEWEFLPAVKCNYLNCS